ncbi:MAG: TlyA family RNA methyltransferase [Anaerolineales bacterium]|jgi:23S rRNA (cytidine1920-2'-O)/16S rRNA (cytidine1409-2'-O)-methyltransferase
MAKKVRLDLLVAERQLAGSRAQAQLLIREGRVRLNGQACDQPGKLADPLSRVELTAKLRYVSRGGEKLEAALQTFPIRVGEQVCADVGASTGGFTDCLLQHGASRVYAIDVGRGILEWKLRNDSRVVVLEGVNARYLKSLPEPIGLATADASFISLRLILPAMITWLGAQGEIVTLVKPQFEAGRKEVGRGGVVRDPLVHRRVIGEVARAAEALGLFVHGLLLSPLVGPAGNREFLLWLRRDRSDLRLETLLDQVVLAR